ncbi:MAG: hypothetical protein AABY53_09045 [Bdellovibrionota bacterium]
MSQKKLIIFTLFVIVAGAVSINEFIVRNSVQERNREVASFGERFEPEQIKWEQELAKTVSKETGKTLIGTKPNLNDKFLFEALAGKYEASVVDGKLLKISLMANQTALNLSIDNLIKDYSSVFKDAKSFERSASDGTTENVILKNFNGKSIGKVTILKDDQGRVINIEIQ